MPTKAAVEKKKTQARELLKQKPELTVQSLVNLTGLSKSTAQRVKQSLTQGTLKETKTPAGITETPANSQEPDEKTTLDFQDSPAPVEKKGVVDSALSSLKGMLGIADEKDKQKAPVVLSAKLDTKRQQFVDAATPTLSLACMALAAWLWGNIGPEYRDLAPDEKVAQRIVEPLLRVYARHASFLTDVNPDVADIGASMFALVGYVHVSLGLYQQIKREKEEYEQGYSPENTNGHRTYRTTSAEPENGTGHESDRHAAVRGTSGSNGAINGANGRDRAGVDQPNFSDKEARQHAALSRLSELDYQHRARRSGKS